MAISTEVWLPILTFALGSFAQLMGEVVRDRRRNRREDEICSRETQARLEERRVEARKQDLASLREQLQTLNRAVGNPPEEPSLGWMRVISEGRINAVILVEAINDPELREDVRKILEATEVLTRAASEPRTLIDESWQTLDTAYEHASIALGKLLRDAA